MSRISIGRRLSSVLGIAAVALATTDMAAQAPATTASLPPVVLKAFQQAYPGAAVSSTSQDRVGGRPVFRVESTDKGRRRSVLYDAAGAVVEVAEQVSEKELPAPVAAAMHSHPRAIYVTGLKVTRGPGVEYHLTVRGTRKTAMVAKPDGTVLSFK